MLTMPQASRHPKDESFNFRVDPKVKADFQSVTEAEDKPAVQVLRDLMRAIWTGIGSAPSPSKRSASPG
jgi:hypothetical protein